MKSAKQKKAVKLEAELVRLTDMVRARRRQLAKLEACPHKDCECRSVWQEVTQQGLASQMDRIGQSVKHKHGAKPAKGRRNSG